MANVESMFYVREKPWHGLGTMVAEAPDSAAALRLAGLDWNVVQKDIMTVDGSTAIPGFKANVRDTDGSVLGIVTDRYRVVQNAEAFSFTDALLDEGVRYETAGSLQGGRRTWVLARLPHQYIINGEEISPYLVFMNAHDGSGAIKAAMTPVRVVCQNTLNLVLSTAKRSWSFNHTGDISGKLDEARDTLLYAGQYMSELGKSFGKLCRIKLSDGKVTEFISALIPDADVGSPLQVAVEDSYLRNNMSDNVLRELKQSNNIDKTHKKALTIPEHNLFLDFLKLEGSPYHHWYPVFTVMLGTGMRVGEVTGLRWCDISWEENMIEINHTLVYYNHAANGCYFNVHTQKIEAGKRRIPMLQSVREAFLEEKKIQEQFGLKCTVVIDGYTDFIFINRFGGVQHQGTLNKAIRRIIRDCNDKQLESGVKNPVLLPRFSCHSLRHTFTTRMVEANVNVKMVQEVLGHKDVSTTLDIYTDVTKELARREFEDLDEKLKENMESARRGLRDSNSGENA